MKSANIITDLRSKLLRSAFLFLGFGIFRFAADSVQFYVAEVSIVPVSAYFDVAAPIVDTVDMSAYGSPVDTSFSAIIGDDQDSRPIYIMWVDTEKKRMHRSSMELPSGDILTSTSFAQVLGVRL